MLPFATRRETFPFRNGVRGDAMRERDAERRSDDEEERLRFHGKEWNINCLRDRKLSGDNPAARGGLGLFPVLHGCPCAKRDARRLYDGAASYSGGVMPSDSRSWRRK